MGSQPPRKMARMDFAPVSCIPRLPTAPLDHDAPAPLVQASSPFTPDLTFSSLTSQSLIPKSHCSFLILAPGYRKGVSIRRRPFNNHRWNTAPTRYFRAPAPVSGRLAGQLRLNRSSLCFCHRLPLPRKSLLHGHLVAAPLLQYQGEAPIQHSGH